MAKNEPPLTTQQVAAILGCHVRTVHRMAEDGRLPGHKLGDNTRAWVFDPAEVRAYKARTGQTDAA